MRYLWIVFIIVGLWFLISAATEDGLLPSGHGVGRIPEVVVGLGMIGYAILRLINRKPRSANDGS